MLNIPHVMLLARLGDFKSLVQANRRGCDNDVALAAHDRLLSSLDEVIEDVRGLVVVESDMERNVDPEMEETLLAEYRDDLHRYGERWHGLNPLPLVDHLRIDHETRHYLDARTGRWHHNGDFGPDIIPITDAELCGLRSITRQIREETGLHFLAYRVDYRDGCIAFIFDGSVTIVDTRRDPFLHRG